MKPKTRPPTMADITPQAKVSIATVSGAYFSQSQDQHPGAGIDTFLTTVRNHSTSR